jgi:HK97 gp10 family phage protein
MIDMNVSTQGLDELYRRLQELPVKLEKNIMRGAIRAGTKPIVEEAQRLAPQMQVETPWRTPGALKRSIRSMSVRVQSSGLIRGGVIAGSRRKTGSGLKRVADVFYAYWLEYGTVKMAARPFMRPAMQSKSQNAVDAMATYIRERIDSELLR